jgi:hypothetical protein
VGCETRDVRDEIRLHVRPAGRTAAAEGGCGETGERRNCKRRQEKKKAT